MAKDGSEIATPVVQGAFPLRGDPAR